MSLPVFPDHPCESALNKWDEAKVVEGEPGAVLKLFDVAVLKDYIEEQNPDLGLDDLLYLDVDGESIEIKLAPGATDPVVKKLRLAPL